MVTHDEAVALCSELSPVFHRAGYLLGLYGSCLTDDWGNDVDLMAVPWRAPDLQSVALALAGLGYSAVPLERGLLADSVLFTKGLLVLDVRVTRYQP